MCIVLLYHQCGRDQENEHKADAVPKPNGYRCILAANHDGWMHRDATYLRWLEPEGKPSILAGMDNGRGTYLGTNKAAGKFAVLTYHRTTYDHFGVIVPDLVFYLTALCGVVLSLAAFNFGYLQSGGFLGGEHIYF
eukprot:SAG22_NODE_8866_length_625_cov_1.275665_1_plen_135_part_10